jgi:uncharacterized protein (TIGR02421 family)
MSKARAASEDGLIEQILAALESGQPIRLDLGNGGRLHIDRPLPFLCVHIARRRELAARGVVSANASYLIARNLRSAAAIATAVATEMEKRFGAFILLDIGELERDRLNQDAPYLPPFEVILSAPQDASAQAALAVLAAAMEAVDTRFRMPAIERLVNNPQGKLARLVPKFPCITVRFAPIYRVPESEAIYPELRDRLIVNVVDAGLQAIGAFVKATKAMALSTHRSLGRRVFVNAVSRADKAMDEIATSFDFLLAVTPINADAAWQEFRNDGFAKPPRFLYRPLTVQVDVQKRALFSIGLDHFEDPVLLDLYREKQQELDLQLSMLTARETPRFLELSRALYGSVEPSLLKVADDILARTASKRVGQGNRDDVGFAFVERKAQSMIKSYAGRDADFAATVELRDDLPAGLMVSNGRLLISRSTVMSRSRVEALLSHEVGVHLLTYFNGSAQGLRLFRSGLAGYEGVQEGLAVLAEFLVGGMTVARLRLIAARVVACAAMLDGASFQENFSLLVDRHNFAKENAFNLVLRLHRGGGLVKDAIYLRGLLEILNHLRCGGSLDPFWMGKIAATHFSVMQEMSARGLLKAPQLMPAFLTHPQAEQRLAAARSGLSPLQMLTG